jgi:hypothetical protein
MIGDAECKKAAELIHALSSPSSTDCEDNRIICEIKEIVPYPRITDNIFYSDKYLNSDGSHDVDRLLDVALNTSQM